MTRDTILEEVLGISSKSILLQLGTGTGKSKLAIEKAMSLNCKNILVVAPKLAILDGWVDEFTKWGYEDFLSHVTFSTYASIQKHIETDWDVVICDEAHHLSERCRDILSMMNIKNILFLSATMPRNTYFFLKALFPDLTIYKIGMRRTIEEGILPDPEIKLIPLVLDNTVRNCIMEVNPKAKKVDKVPVAMNKNNYWRASRDKTTKYLLQGTAQEYYNLISELIEFYKRKAMGSTIMKNKQLKMAGDRLKWLARQKNLIVKRILKKLEKERTLTFCCDIEQSNYFGPNSINSKKKEALDVLDSFNSGEINHIQSCNMLDEGVNLVDCRIGIFANINASERMITQRNGRILRHKNPIIILPYFKKTREEEIVSTMLTNYNSELISTLKSISELTIK